MEALCPDCGELLATPPDCCSRAKRDFARDQINHESDCPYCLCGCEFCEPEQREDGGRESIDFGYHQPEPRY